MEEGGGNGVDHGGKSGEGEDGARDFDGALFGGALNFVDAFGMRHRADVPDVAEDFACVGDEEGGEFAVILPGAGDGVFVDRTAGGVKEKRLGRDVGLRAVEADGALALLLRIVKKMLREGRT